MANGDTTQEDAGTGVGVGPGPHLVRDLLAGGLTRGQLRWMLQRGEIQRIHRGVVAPVTDGAESDAGAGPLDDYVLSIRAVLSAISDRAIVSHESAAAVHGVSSWRRATRVSVLLPGEANRTDGDVAVRGTSAPDRHVAVVGGIRVTSVERTGVDCARGLALPEALVALDSAARMLVVRRWPEAAPALLRTLVQHPAVRGWVASQLNDAWRSVFGWPGSRVVRDALPLVDPASESPLESRSRGWFAQSRLPRPQIGRGVTGASGRRYYTDFCWDSVRLVGEADGWTKYGDDAVSMRRTVAAERTRQQDLERNGWRFVRWSTDDDRDAVVARVSDALARAAFARPA